jgi:hypothetical protein
MLAGMLLLVALLLAVGLASILFGGEGEDFAGTGGDGGATATGPHNEREACGRAHRPPPSHVRADEGRYAVAIPQGWDGRARGSVVKLWDKASRARLAVGLAPSGTLTSALLDLRSSLHRAYRGLRVTRRNRLEVGGCPARSIAGRVLNRNGLRLSFKGLVVAGPENNYALAGFVVRGAERRISNDLTRAMRSISAHAPAGN